LVHAGFLLVSFFNPKDEAKISSEMSMIFNGLQDVITQKIELFISTGVRTSDPT
jgi:hypothetical protein